MRRRRWRTAVLWVGWTLCVLIVIAFLASIYWVIRIQLPFKCVITLAYGAFRVYFDASPGSALTHWATSLAFWNQWWISSGLGGGGGIPLYALFLAVALPTLLVWRFVPKFPRGHCRSCGYNLKGLTEPRCPECGTGFGRDTLEAGRCR